MTPERELLLKALVGAGGPARPSELAAAVGKQSGAIRKMLTTMKQAGQVEQVSYGYWQAVTPAVTVSGNTSGQAVTLPGKVKGLSDIEKARIAYNLEQNQRNARPENRAKRNEASRKWRKANREKVNQASQKWRKEHPDAVKASWIKQYAKKYDRRSDDDRG